MKQILIAAALAMVVLTGCNREEEATVVPPQSSMPDSGSVGSTPGSETPAGLADSPAGNQSGMNTTDSTSTQQQLDPVPSSGSTNTSVETK